MMQRNVVYDLMKGIALILMMYDHLVKTPDGVHQFIYSFHMPLFFILAGIFAKNISASINKYVDNKILIIQSDLYKFEPVTLHFYDEPIIINARQ